MIEVTVRNNGIQVNGHAGYAPIDQDIVCAGVSALTQSLIRSIEDLSNDEIKCSVSPGKVDINYENLSEKSQTLVDSFFIGIRMIAAEYPNYVGVL